MALPIAIACENDDLDASIYLALAARILGREVTRYPTERRFSGWKSVVHLAAPFLADAARHGVRHAILAIDNDGGSKRAPEHAPEHDAAAQAADPDGCRHCLLAEAVPGPWREGGGRSCVIVPVQTLETWLLVLRGDAFDTATPEATYHRPTLKKRFYGSPLPATARRVALAEAQIRRPDAIEVLRARPSFVRFEQALGAWA